MTRRHTGVLGTDPAQHAIPASRPVRFSFEPQRSKPPSTPSTPCSRTNAADRGRPRRPLRLGRRLDTAPAVMDPPGSSVSAPLSAVSVCPMNRSPAALATTRPSSPMLACQASCCSCATRTGPTTRARRWKWKIHARRRSPEAQPPGGSRLMRHASTIRTPAHDRPEPARPDLTTGAAMAAAAEAGPPDQQTVLRPAAGWAARSTSTAPSDR